MFKATKHEPPPPTVADALRTVARRIAERYAAGKRSWAIDAGDLMETLLSVADILEPPVRAKTKRRTRHED